MQIQFGKPLQPRPERAPPSMTLPLIVGGAIQFALPLLAASGSDRAIDPAADPAYFLGRVAGSMLIVGLVLWFGFGRKRDPRGWWKILLVLLPIALAANFVAAGRDSGGPSKAMDSLADASERMIESDGRDAGALRHSGATGEAGELERVLLEYFRIAGARRQAYDRAIAEAGIATMLDPQVLSRDPGQRRARAGLEVARAALARAIAEDASATQDFRRLIESADLGARARRDAIEGLEAAASRNAPRTHRIRAIDAELYDVMERALDILRAGRWRAAGPEFRFDREADASAYNAQIARLQSLSAAQERLLAEQNRDAASAVRSFRKEAAR